jgi:ribosome-binding factor A
MNNPGRRRPGAPPCDSFGPDDGIDPRVLFRPESRRRGDRGVRRLCSQVSRTLTFALAACRDDVLQSLFVESVAPAPDATRLAVTVRADDPIAATERLGHAASLLRSEVAASVNRRRAPELVFRVLPAGEAQP